MLKPWTLRLLFCLVCVSILGSNFWTMRNWTERTGVYDDICYLRQAHLFQRFGLGVSRTLPRGLFRFCQPRNTSIAGAQNTRRSRCLPATSRGWARRGSCESACRRGSPLALARPQLLRYVVENASERLNLARHMDRSVDLL